MVSSRTELHLSLSSKGYIPEPAPWSATLQTALMSPAYSSTTDSGDNLGCRVNAFQLDHPTGHHSPGLQNSKAEDVRAGVGEYGNSEVEWGSIYHLILG